MSTLRAKKLRPEVKEALVKALRSGKYEQTTGRLRREAENRYCCLGVLCDISGMGEWHRDIYVCPDDYSGSMLPHKVLYWAMDDCSSLRGADRGILIDPTATRWESFVGQADPSMLSLASLNDMGVSFDVIADIVEDLL